MKLGTESQRDHWIEFVRSQPLPLDVACKRWHKTRSNEQNALLWLMYAPIAEAMGFDKDDLHEWFCGKFFGWRDVKVPRTPRNPSGLASVPVRTTTRGGDGQRSVMDSRDFTKFVDMVERVAAQAGVYVSREAA